MAATARKSKNKPERDTLLEAELKASTFKPDGTPDLGWSKWPRSFTPILKRICRDLSQYALIETVWHNTVGRRDRAGKYPAWSPVWSWAELAEYLDCSPDQVKDDAHDARDRGLLTMEESWGGARFQLLWTAWAKIVSYRAQPRPVLEIPRKVEHKGGRTVSVAPGASYRYPVQDAIKGIDLQNVDIEGFSFKAAPAEDGWLALAVVKNARYRKTNGLGDAIQEHTPDSVAVSVTDDTVKNAGIAGGGIAGIQVQVPRLLVEAVASFGSVTDDGLVKFVADCRAVAPECTEEEMVFYVRQIGESARGNRKVNNLVGWILKMVPRHFASEAYRLDRAVRDKQQFNREWEHMRALQELAQSGDEWAVAELERRKK